MRDLLASRKVMRSALIVSIVVALIVSTVGLAFAQGPVISLDPTSIEQGKYVTSITGAGFQPEESVLIVLVGAINGEDYIMAGAQANAAGALYIKGTANIGMVPVTVPPGVYTVKATGTKDSVAIAALNVTAKPKPTPTPAATPKPTAAPATGTPLPIGWLALVATAFTATGFALRRRRG